MYLIKYAKWKLGFCRRLRKYTPIIVYQMGKVSSRSVYEPLAACHKGAVIHAHTYGEGSVVSGETRELMNHIKEHDGSIKLTIISLVREPLRRNVSSFFANIHKYIGCGISREEGASRASKMPLDELRAIYLDQFPHDQPLDWFDGSIKKHFGIDVFAHPFPDCGYRAYDSGLNSLLVMRMELPDDTKNEAVRNFTGLAQFSVSRANDTSEKAIGDVYKRFCMQVKFPEVYVDRYCNSRYCQTFYGESLINQMRSAWIE